MINRWIKSGLMRKKQYLEAANVLLQFHIFSWGTSEDFSDMERLAQESLDLTGTGNSQFIIFTKLIHSQNGNDILKILVVLKNLLYTTSSFIVLRTQNKGWKHTRCRIQGVNSRIDTKLGDLFNIIKIKLFSWW